MTTSNRAVSNADTVSTVWSACCEIVGNEGAPLDVHANLFDLGLDSLGLAELVIQLESTYGDGAITIDDVGCRASHLLPHMHAHLPSPLASQVLANPIVSVIAALLPGCEPLPAPAAAAKKTTAPAPPIKKPPTPLFKPPTAAPAPAAKTKTSAPVAAPPADGRRTAVFFFAGEGAHSAGADLTVLKTSPAWPAVDAAMLSQHGVSADAFLETHLGNHAPPHSPLVSTILNLLQADLWRLWGRTRSRPHHPQPAPPAARSLQPSRRLTGATAHILCA
jgi:hypothetical protein